MIAELDLFDWRRAVFDLYARVRADVEPHAAWRAWRRGRDALFSRHPQTPLEAEAVPGFAGLPYFPYDPALRVAAANVRAGRS